MNDSLPSELIDKFSPSQLAEANEWWKNLPAASRTEVIVLLDTRKAGRGYVYSIDENRQRKWQSIPILNDTLPERDHDDEEFWVEELIHYRLDHEDFVMTSDLESCEIRCFGVCSQHASAQEVIANKAISKTFSCSNNDKNCPIRRFSTKFEMGVMLDHNPDTGRSLWLTR